MKKVILALLWIMSCFLKPDLSSGNSCNQQSENLSDSSLRSSNFISLSDAERILGQPAHLKDSLHKRTGGYLRYQFNYKANAKDTVTGETASLFFGIEEYKQASEAARAYALIKKENEKSSAVSELKQMGDEGILVKDALNFPFIMIRKNNRVYKFKLHNVISNTSLDELQSVAKRIVAVW
jgi:hypothetical protein